MKNANDYFGQTMDDIIFENRNKNYGAYILRKKNDSYILRGLFFVLFTVTGFAVFSLTKKTPVEEIIDVLTVTTTEIKNIFDPPVAPESSDPLPPKTSILPAAPTTDFRNMRPVSNDSVPDKALTPIDSLAGKVIGASNNPSGTPGGSTNPLLGGDGNGKKVDSAGIGVEKKNEIKVFAEVMPSFDNMTKWLQKNIRYPRIAVDANVEGPVYVEFVVNTDGSIVDAKVVRGIGFGCDEEALRAVKAMPKWKPGKQAGTPVRVRMTVPIQFKLNK
ncbi:MAG: energy transducer TonB [Chitinophagales bacterium]